MLNSRIYIFMFNPSSMCPHGPVRPFSAHKKVPIPSFPVRVTARSVREVPEHGKFRHNVDGIHLYVVDFR